ncbi:polysaccharide biosynthesis tyrosine autokinase [Geodermatophilus ruber]|uniref:non-specific protein-tyrosine kinase n=1 Tax=Geodermatophilus ruber TaxID=504800 RepID=A0A1I4DHT3_9ACTN|nr:polysaccharide biosynthesis tyrosine autokinase [Geodermatophilus ruber]SFK92429.1 receptor protein-tyrosine kinase [Geodermatophilus ruber]
MEFREVLAALRAAWWLPLIGLLVGGAAALLVSLLQTPLYTASTQLFVSTRDTASTSEAFQGSQFSQQRVTSYARLLTGEELAGRVVDRLGLDESPSALSEQITATAVTDTVLIDVTVTDPAPEQAQRIAAAVGEEFTALVTELETPDGGGASPVKVTITDRPEVAAAPSSPQTARNLALGLLVGLLVGAGLAVLRARLDRTVKDPEETAELAGAPVIGTVLRDEGLEKRHVVERLVDNRTAEDYRQLRTNLQFLNVDQPPKVIMVSSALPSEGKTTMVINLALALADAGQRVTVVEADLRRPKLTRYLGMVSGVGLTNILAGTADVEDVTQTYRDGVSVIASGPTPPNPGELLASSHMAALVTKLREQSDFVLVDAPPLLPVADSAGLAAAMDGVLLSVRYGSTRKDQLQQAGLTLERVGATTLGVVLNIVPPKAELASVYGYGYSYETGTSNGGHEKGL